MDIRLRPVADGDIAALQAIGPDHAAYVAFGGDPTGHPSGGHDWASGIIGRVQAAYFGRIIEVDGELAGEIKLQFENLTDRNARLAIWVYDPSLRAKGIGQHAIALTLDEAFGALELHRIELRVLAHNTLAIRCYEAAGFQHEGRLREIAKIADSYADEWVMSVLATDERPKRP